MTDNIQALEEERYKTEMVCVYCGEPMYDKNMACCGELHFDTQENIDGENNERKE